MANVAFVDWYDDVLPHAKGCPAALALQKIREATIEFCTKSRAWRHLSLTGLNVTASVQSYTIGTAAGAGEMPSNTVIVHVFHANFDDVQITPCTPAEFRALSETWNEDTGTPTAFTFFKAGEISLYEIPESTASAILTLPDVALAPSQAATEVVDSIWERHRSDITIGALAKIFMLPKKPYSDPNLGMKYEQDFFARCASAGAAVAGGRGHARLRTRVISR